MDTPSSIVGDTAGKRRNFAVVSMVTDNIIGLGAVFVASMVENFAHLDQIDFILLKSKVSAPLSEEYEDLIRRIYPQIIFREVEEGFLNEENTRLDKYDFPVSVSTRQAPYLKLHLLRFSEYQRVVWVDSDTLVLHDFFEVMKLPWELCVVRGGPAEDHMPGGISIGKSGKFNSGFMVFGPKYLQSDWFEGAIKLLNQRTNFILRDQSILNRLLLKEDKVYLPDTYNWKLKHSPEGWSDDEFGSRCAKVVHFVGSTKWTLVNPQASLGLARRFHGIREKYQVPLRIEH